MMESAGSSGLMGHTMHTLEFIKQCILEPHQLGAIAPSGKILGDRVTDCAGVRDARVVVEFGPGDGAITEVLLGKLQPGATFFGIEINDDLVRVFNKRFPAVTCYHDSATNTGKYLAELGHDHCDSIVSGLPWAVFSDQLQDDLLDCVEQVLRPGGRFATYMYLQSPVLPGGRKFKQKLAERFGHYSKSPIVWKNLPPAVVLHVQKPASAS